MNAKIFLLAFIVFVQILSSESGKTKEQNQTKSATPSKLATRKQGHPVGPKGKKRHGSTHTSECTQELLPSGIISKECKTAKVSVRAENPTASLNHEPNVQNGMGQLHPHEIQHSPQETGNHEEPTLFENEQSHIGQFRGNSETSEPMTTHIEPQEEPSPQAQQEHQHSQEQQNTPHSHQQACGPPPHSQSPSTQGVKVMECKEVSTHPGQQTPVCPTGQAGQPCQHPFPGGAPASQHPIQQQPTQPIQQQPTQPIQQQPTQPIQQQPMQPIQQQPMQPIQPVAPHPGAPCQGMAGGIAGCRPINTPPVYPVPPVGGCGGSQGGSCSDDTPIGIIQVPQPASQMCSGILGGCKKRCGAHCPKKCCQGGAAHHMTHKENKQNMVNHT